MWSKNNARNEQSWQQYKQQATLVQSKSNIQWEEVVQKQAVAWFHLAYPQYFQSFYHIPNGGHRNINVARKLKLMGVKKGMLDLHLDIPHKAKNGTFYYGLRVEIKPGKEVAKSQVTDEQRATIKVMNENGYFATVCYGFNQIKDTFEWYLA